MPNIHPLAIVDPNAEIADDVRIGPFCFVEAKVKIGPGCVLDSHVTIKSNTIIGNNNVFGQGAILGGDPQDRHYKGEETFLEIGDDNAFREYVTIHRATGEGNSTKIANRCLIMGYCHVGHNCQIDDDVTIANYSGISGHVTIEQLVNVGGMTGIHQFCRIGKIAMVGGMSRITQDCPPYMVTSGGEKQEVRDINAIGLRRIGVTPEERMALHRACKLIFKSQLGLTNALNLVQEEIEITPHVAYLLEFMQRRFRSTNGRGDQH